METVVSKSKLKPKVLEYLREVERSHLEIVITDRGRPVAKIIPYAGGEADPLAVLRSSVLRYDRPTEPLEADDWEALR